MNEGCLFDTKILISGEVDKTLEQVIDYILKDYLYSWATTFVPDDPGFRDSLTTKIKNELWIALNNLIGRIRQVDTLTFFSEKLPRILKKHFKKFDLEYAHQVDDNQHIVRFMVARHLEDDRAEQEFIRKICEFLLRSLLPNNYSVNDEFIFLLREVLTNYVFSILIDYICDPYFINNQAIIHGSVVGPVAPTLDSSYGSLNATSSNQNCNQPPFPLDDGEEYKEDISDPIYDLVCEIFVLGKAQHWLRRTIINIFQALFGKTIYKQLKDSIFHLTSEGFILDKLNRFRDTFWPDGVAAESYPMVSEDDRKLTYLLAKQYLINSIPDVFSNLLGPQTAKKGFLKVFEAMQSKKANKQLFYDTLEAFMLELFPELTTR